MGVCVSRDSVTKQNMEMGGFQPNRHVAVFFVFFFEQQFPVLSNLSPRKSLLFGK